MFKLIQNIRCFQVSVKIMTSHY